MTDTAKTFPANWQIAADFDPNDHLIQLKGRDYLTVQSRLLWFIRDQRALIASGLATMAYVVRSELVEMDRTDNWAHYKTYVRDVLGNEATMYGSESAQDFADYAEKASTKSLGRALLALGYGTAFASEMDEGARVVDSPVVRREAMQRDRQPSVVRESPALPAARPMPGAANGHEAGAPRPTASAGEEPPATEKQEASIRKLCEALGKPEPEGPLTYARARELLTQLSGEYQRVRRAS
ncbi:MAG TPA: hypothetical protein VGS80_18890 [Ktedonobacterales bacterium]|nr:hypothetical protein [Ktedonobacterales bacterium]